MRALNAFMVGNDRCPNEEYGSENDINFLAVSRSQELVLVFFNRNNTTMDAKRTDPYGPQEMDVAT